MTPLQRNFCISSESSFQYCPYSEQLSSTCTVVGASLDCHSFFFLRLPTQHTGENSINILILFYCVYCQIQKIMALKGVYRAYGASLPGEPSSFSLVVSSVRTLVRRLPTPRRWSSGAFSWTTRSTSSWSSTPSSPARRPFSSTTKSFTRLSRYRPSWLLWSP